MNEETYFKVVAKLGNIYELVRANRFSEIDNLILAIKLNESEPELIEAYVRVLHPLRKMLSNYNWLFYQSKQEFKDRDLDPENYLKNIEI